MTSTSHSPQALPRDATRVRALDGVRGVAALVVVLHHALQVDPTFARVQARESAAGEGPVVWALTHTPLHVVWAGEEAVLVFFVLSGFVLTLPATRRAVRWREYYPRRLLRLYVPVWGSLVLAVALTAALAGRADDAASPFLRDRALAPPGEVWHDAALLSGTGLLNSPLWSLRWEVLFSLALPLYLLALRRRSGRWALVDAAVLITLIGVGTATHSLALRYLPVFGLGVMLAYHQDRLIAATDWLEHHRRPGFLWAAVAVGVSTLLTARWLVDGLPFTHPLLEAGASGASILGATAVVVLALRWAPCAQALERGPAQWLGARSFSLYLVHEPAIVAVALLVAPAAGTWFAAAGGAVVAVAVTMAFYRLVEHPSIGLARRAGELFRPAPSRHPPAATAPAEPVPGPAAAPVPAPVSRPDAPRRRPELA